MKLAVDTVLYLVNIRDKEHDLFDRTKVPELKVMAKFRGLLFKNNLRKQPLIELMVRAVCQCLSFFLNRPTTGYGNQTWNILGITALRGRLGFSQLLNKEGFQQSAHTHLYICTIFENMISLANCLSRAMFNLFCAQNSVFTAPAFRG